MIPRTRQDRPGVQITLITTVFLGLAGSLVQAAPLFPNPGYPVGPIPSGMVMADFDGDGIQDLVTSGYAATGSVSILLGRADGTFAPEIRRGTSQPVWSFVAVKLNGDGLPDLVLRFETSAALLLNRGHGTFGPEVPVTTNLVVDGVIAGDFDGDGRADILLSGLSGGVRTFQAQFSRGDGTLRPGPEVAAGDVVLPAFADVNGDGLGDVVALWVGESGEFSTPTNEIHLFVGHGDGTFQAPAAIPLTEYAFIVIPADLNGDGRIDLAAGTYHFNGSYSVLGPSLIYYGRGDGGFDPGPADALQPYLTGLSTADLNRDGVPDIVDLGISGVMSHLGRADGTFSAGQSFGNAGLGLIGVAVNDFDRDGRVDLAVLIDASDAVFTYLGNGDGTFGPPLAASVQDLLLGNIAAADFNGDGRLDLAIGQVSTNQVAVLLGNGAGLFGPETRYTAGESPSAVAVGDFDRDGRPDLAVVAVNWHDILPDPVPIGSLAILRGRGDGTFDTASLYATGFYPVAVTVADLDGDGDLDIVVLNGGGGYGVASDVSMFRGRGDGSFDPESRVAVGDFASGIAVADFTRDGRPDLVVTHRGSFSNDFPYEHIAGNVSFQSGRGDGTFGTPVVFAQIFSASSVVAVDLNRDGKMDTVVADEGDFSRETPGGVLAYLGNGSGGFSTGIPAAAGAAPLEVQAADFNVDGLPDVSVSNNSGDTSILLGRGNGHFDPESRYGLFGLPAGLASGDFNGDQRPDLVAASTAGLFVLANRGTGGGAATKVLNIVMTVPGPAGAGSALITWNTDQERGLRGFNVVTGKGRGRVQYNTALIPCRECTTGRGASYQFVLVASKLPKSVNIEVVFQDGHVATFGPSKRVNR